MGKLYVINIHVVEPLAATIGIQFGFYKRGDHISGFPRCYNTVGTKVSGFYREDDWSGVAIKWGSIQYMWHIILANFRCYIIMVHLLLYTFRQDIIRRSLMLGVSLTTPIWCPYVQWRILLLDAIRWCPGCQVIIKLWHNHYRLHCISLLLWAFKYTGCALSHSIIITTHAHTILVSF